MLSPSRVSGAYLVGEAHVSAGSSRAQKAPEPNPALVEWVILARTGDMAAQTELIRRYQGRISGFVRSIIAQPAAVEDVVQTVFIKMSRRILRLRDPAVFEAWLFSLSRNTSYDFLRRRRRRPITVADEIGLLGTPDPANSRARLEIEEALENALARLKPRDRELVTRIVQGHSYRAIATRLGLTPGAVRARLAKLRPYLRASVGGVLGTHAPDRARLRSIPRLPIAA